MNQDKIHIVITGPESTGKTSILNVLKNQLDAYYIEEYAREYLKKKEVQYQREDLQSIAFSQLQKQLSAFNIAQDLIISDTCLLTTLIWDEYKYKQYDGYIAEWYALQQVDYYLLCKPDLVWEPDPLRENPHDQDQLFDLYEQKILEAKIPYDIVYGTGESRFELARTLIDKFIMSKGQS